MTSEHGCWDFWSRIIQPNVFSHSLTLDAGADPIVSPSVVRSIHAG